MKSGAKEIKELCRQVEASVNRKISTPADFEFLVGVVWERTHETISVSTLKRMWGYVRGGESLREKTLDQLSRCVGFGSWDEFLKDQYCCNEAERDVCLYDVILSEDVEEGSVVEVSWRHGRKCRLSYLGNNRYQVIETTGGNYALGDIILCAAFYKNGKMFVDDFRIVE